MYQNLGSNDRKFPDQDFRCMHHWFSALIVAEIENNADDDVQADTFLRSFIHFFSVENKNIPESQNS